MSRKGLSLTFALIASVSLAPYARAGKTTTGTVLSHNLKLAGTQSVSSASAPSATVELGTETREGPEQDRDFDKQITGSISPARVPAANVPAPLGKSVQPGAAFGFDGLTHRDQRLADNGNQFSSEPPDQGLAVGNGYIVETVNSAIRFRLTNGAIQGTTLSLNKFFGLPSALLRTTPPVYGPFTADPRAYYDPNLKRFFVTMLVIDQDPATGAFLPHSSLKIAVSKSSNPLGDWYLYSLETTNDGTNGTPSHAGCPCFGDQPLIGADANGFYITTNEFSIFEEDFNGAQVYALSKSALAAGTLPAVIMISPGTLEDGMSYTLQPATTPPGAPYATINGGTEYFLSALDFAGRLDNRIAVWALTGTSTLTAATPAVTLQYSIVDSEVYGQPPAMQQKDGPLPLADAIRAGVYGKPATEHLPLIDSNDDRMQQTVFAAGKLWSALNTVVQTKNGPVQTGIAWFIVTPSWSGSTLSGTMANQGYISVNRNSVAYPAVAVNPAGKGIIGFSLIGPDQYPSAAYVTIDAGGTSNVLVAKAGTEPDDGYTGYVTFNGRVGRWGDYSAASADESGSIWFATEYIPGGLRTALANWGTYIAKVVP